MLQKDYILRIIEQLGEFMVVIYSNLQKRKFRQAHKIIEDAYNELLQADAADFAKLPEEKIINTLQQKHDYNQEKMQVVAELMFAEAEVEFHSKKYGDAGAFYRKSLCIFRYLDEKQKIYSAERLEKIKVIEERLSKIMR